MSLSAIRPASAADNQANSFNVYSINVNPSGGSNISTSTEVPFTANWTGPTTVSTSVLATLSGNIVTLTLPASVASGSSSATVLASQAGALPTSLRPTNQLIIPAIIVNNGASAIGAITISTSGLLSFAPAAGGTYTSSSTTTGFLGTSVSYHI
jgi:hypothetical protein